MSKNNKSLVTVSIVTWNHEDTIIPCLVSVLDQDYQKLEILVFDNNSSDKTKEGLYTLEQKYYQKFQYQVNTKNIGFCGGHNHNIKIGAGEFVILVNPDIILPKEYISEAIKIFSMSDKIGTVCGVLFNKVSNESKYLDGAGLKMRRMRKFELIAHGNNIDQIPNYNFEVFGCDGALPFYRKKMIEDISINNSFFDEMFFAHKEDHDIVWRSRLFGWKTVCATKCIAFHPRNFKPNDLKVRKNIPKVVKYHAVKNQLILLLKNEDFQNFIRDIFIILTYHIKIFIFLVFFERNSLKAYIFILKNFSKIYHKRKIIKKKQVMSWRELRHWMDLDYKVLE